jgi:hypothetical protein
MVALVVLVAGVAFVLPYMLLYLLFAQRVQLLAPEVLKLIDSPPASRAGESL